MSLASVITTAVNPWAKYKWAAIALVVVLWHIAYGAFWSRHGRLGVQHEWDTAKAVADHEAQRLERARQSSMDAVVKLAATRTHDDYRRAGNVDDAAERMRVTLDATERAAKDSSDAAAKAITALGADLRSCLAEYRSLGKDAAGYAADSLMYQEGWPK